MLAVQLKIFAFLLVIAAVCSGRAQESNTAEKPQVKVNVLNVCTPSPEEQKEIASALKSIPQHPSFSPDFEVDRGRSVLDPGANPLTGERMQPANDARVPSEPASAEFVRIRHDFPSSLTFSNVQYSFSRDSEQMVETLVFRMREPKDLLEVSIESSASSVTTPAAMLAAGTPAGRIKLERFGKSSVVLARCSATTSGQAIDQSAYEPLFSSASAILSDYRTILSTRKMVPEELARLGAPAAHRHAAGAQHR